MSYAKEYIKQMDAVQKELKKMQEDFNVDEAHNLMVPIFTQCGIIIKLLSYLGGMIAQMGDKQEEMAVQLQQLRRDVDDGK